MVRWSVVSAAVQNACKVAVSIPGLLEMLAYEKRGLLSQT